MIISLSNESDTIQCDFKLSKSYDMYLYVTDYACKKEFKIQLSNTTKQHTIITNKIKSILELKEGIQTTKLTSVDNMYNIFIRIQYFQIMTCAMNISKNNNLIFSDLEIELHNLEILYDYLNIRNHTKGDLNE